MPSGTAGLRILPNLLVLGVSAISLDSCERMATPQVTEEMVQTYPLAAGSKVKVETSRGAIFVSGWDRQECKVEAVKYASDSEQLASITLTVDAKGDSASIRGTAPQGNGNNTEDGPRVDIRVWVPRDAELANIVSGRGEVTIREIDGNVVALIVNGSVLAEHVAGNLTLKCVNGRTVARLTTLARGQCVDLETVNGSTSVVLPVQASADISAHVYQGMVLSDLDLPIEPDFPAGMKLVGRVGAGGATVQARTANGSVSVWKGH